MSFHFILIACLLTLTGTQTFAVDSFNSIDIRHRSAQTVDDFNSVEALIQGRLILEPDSVDLNWRLARVFFSLGEQADNASDQTHYFDQCAEQAYWIIETFPQRAEGYYFNGLCLGKRGQINGLWRSLLVITPFQEAMETAVRLDPRVEFGGPHRALGRLFHDLPVLLGGDLDTAIRHLKLAAQYGPHYPDNHLFLAKALYENDRIDDAQKSLDTFFQTQPDQKEKKLGQELQQMIRTRLVGTEPHAQGTQHP